jgi:DHA3 family tetracycline resistance protein-like MFS transporter
MGRNLTRFKVLGNRNFLFLYLGGVVSASGATMTSLTIVWLVYTQTKSALAITYLGVASVIPTITFGILAGAVVDRFDRRKLMIVSDLVRAVTVAMIPIYLVWRGFDLLFTVAAVILVAVFSTIFRPATNALLPTIVPGEAVQDANGLISASNSMTQMMANAVAGILVVLTGVVLGLVYNTLTYLVSALMIFLMVVPRCVLSSETLGKSVATDVREGLRFMVRNKAILGTTLGSTVLNFFATMIMPFLVVYVSVHLVANASVYGILLAGLSLGMAAGSMLVGRLKTVGFAGKLMVFASVGFGLATIGLASLRSTTLSIILTVSMGLALGLLNTTFFSVIQLVVPNDVLGRVLSIDEVGSYAAIPLGQIAAGLLIEKSGIVATYMVAGFGILITAMTMLLLKDLRNLRYVEDTSGLGL